MRFIRYVAIVVLVAFTSRAVAAESPTSARRAEWLSGFWPPSKNRISGPASRKAYSERSKPSQTRKAMSATDTMRSRPRKTA